MSFPSEFRLLPLAFVLSAIATPSFAQPCPPGLCDRVAPPSVELRVDAITPSTDVVEHSPIDVAVTATLGHLLDTPPRNGHVCVRQLTPDCVPVTLHRNRAVRKTIRTRAPSAGAGVRIEVFYCETEPAQGLCVEKSSQGSEQLLAIAARYEVMLKSFEILHTRARSRDTVELALAGVAGAPGTDASPLCNIVGPPTYCVRPVQQGSFGDGEHVVRGDVRVGPFTLVPESGPDLNVHYVVANNGHSHNEKAFLAFMNVLNTFGAGIYSSMGKSGGSDLKAATGMLNDAMATDCDGVVLDESRTLLNRTIEGQYASTLDARTRESGFWDYRGEIHTVENKTTCGDSSKYRISFRVARTSWQAPSLGDPDRTERVSLTPLSEEHGPRYCPSGTALAEVGCSGRYCDNLHLVCGRYARENPMGHRDVDAHQWSGWYSEENGGHPPGWIGSSPVTGFVTGVDCRGDYCDDIRVDSDATVKPVGQGTPIATISEETGPARCPTGEFVTKLLCSGSNCDNVAVWCSR